MKKLLKYYFNTNKWSPTKAEWLALLCALPKDERERISRYMFKRDQKQTLIGQVLIRYTLKNQFNLKWNHIVLSRDAKSRPYLNQAETVKLSGMKNLFKSSVLDFNVTHSGDYSAIVSGVLTTTSEVSSGLNFRIGVDMMKIDIDRSKIVNPDETNLYNLYESELGQYARVINSKFGDNERNFIQNKSNSVEKLTAFYRLWCLKESYVKAVGDGIGFDLRRIECQITSDLFIDLNNNSTNRNKCLVVDNTHVAVDAKPVRNCKFYEQYFLNRIENNLNHLSELYILTFCVIEVDTASSASAESGGEMLEEFKEVNLSDVMSCVIPVENIGPVNEPDFEKNWSEFCEKAEKPFTPPK